MLSVIETREQDSAVPKVSEIRARTQDAQVHEAIFQNLEPPKFLPATM
jgi:hypothetical protein